MANCTLFCLNYQVTSLEGLKFLIKNIDKKEQEYTKNIEYKEVFNNLQKVKTTSNIFLIINIIVNNTANHLQNPVFIC